MIAWRRRGLLVAAAAALIGCGSMTDDRPAKWSFISATITEPSCATVNCHSAVAQRSGLDLHDRATGFQNLVGKGYVNVMAPDQSPVLYWMNGNGTIRMPPDVPLPAADITLIRNWIAAGAPND